MMMFDQGMGLEETVKMFKTKTSKKGHQVSNFVQTCNLIFVYNDMYTVCSMIHLSGQARLIAL